MTKKRRKRKKRLKIKKKNFIIFIFLIIIIFFIFYKLTNFIIYTFTKEEEQPIKIKEVINNPYKEYDYYVKEYDTRYKNYSKNNPNLSIKEVIIDVNIGLDQEVFTSAKKIENTNTNLILVNKYNYLEKEYEPNDLEIINNQYSIKENKLKKEAKEAFEQMAKDIKKENMKIVALSTYRSYSYQEKLYNQYKKKDGEEKADTYSGRPGFSEHQTGLAVDVYDGTIDYTKFEKTNEFIWMKENAYKYGFILRFPKDKTNKTRYIYESWHYRYVGKDIAKYIYENNICLEEYYATVLIKEKSSK